MPVSSSSMTFCLNLPHDECHWGTAAQPGAAWKQDPICGWQLVQCAPGSIGSFDGVVQLLPKPNGPLVNEPGPVRPDLYGKQHASQRSAACPGSHTLPQMLVAGTKATWHTWGSCRTSSANQRMRCRSKATESRTPGRWTFIAAGIGPSAPTKVPLYTCTCAHTAATLEHCRRLREPITSWMCASS